jgi:hypothetical protein
VAGAGAGARIHLARVNCNCVNGVLREYSPSSEGAFIASRSLNLLNFEEFRGTTLGPLRRPVSFGIADSLAARLGGRLGG